MGSAHFREDWASQPTRWGVLIELVFPAWQKFTTAFSHRRLLNARMRIVSRSGEEAIQATKVAILPEAHNGSRTISHKALGHTRTAIAYNIGMGQRKKPHVFCDHSRAAQPVFACTVDNLLEWH